MLSLAYLHYVVLSNILTFLIFSETIDPKLQAASNLNYLDVKRPSMADYRTSPKVKIITTEVILISWKFMYSFFIILKVSKNNVKINQSLTRRCAFGHNAPIPLIHILGSNSYSIEQIKEKAQIITGRSCFVI